MDSASSGAKPTKVAVIGISSNGTCGVRDHAELLAEGLTRERVPCEFHWLERVDGSLRGSRSEIRAWTRGLAVQLAESRPDAILLHYSVFSYSYKGLPLFVRPTVAALRASGIPVVAVLHELAYPWGQGGWRGSVWALTHRALLLEVIRASSAVIVTADFRAEWLSSRRWLPARPVAVAPVFSNLPPPAAGPPPSRALPVVGLFGYSFEPATISLVIDAVRRLRDRGIQMQLLLLGAPGPSSPAGEMWAKSAESRGLAQVLSFTGVLSAQELSDAPAATDILLYADITGPASRKGTLAASLASGRPVIALEGRRRWSQLVDSEAARLVARTPDALAEALQALLADEGAREALGARGRAFAEQAMSVERTVEAVRVFLDNLAAGGSSSAVARRGPPRGAHRDVRPPV